MFLLFDLEDHNYTVISTAPEKTLIRLHMSDTTVDDLIYDYSYQLILLSPLRLLETRHSTDQMHPSGEVFRAARFDQQ